MTLTGQDLAPGEWHLRVNLPPYQVHEFRFFRLEPEAPARRFRIHVVNSSDPSDTHHAWSWLIRMLQARESDRLAAMEWDRWQMASGGHVVELPREPWYEMVRSLASAICEIGLGTAYPKVPE